MMATKRENGIAMYAYSTGYKDGHLDGYAEANGCIFNDATKTLIDIDKNFPIDIEEERKEFEVFVTGTNFYKKVAPSLGFNMKNNSFFDYRVNDRWLAWKAARGIE